MRATFQGAPDIASPHSFDRADPGRTERAVRAWESDGGLSGVVGDWHSHPSGTGEASITDRNSWRKLARAERAAVVGLIVGDEAMDIYLTELGWRGLSTRRYGLIEKTGAELIYG